MISSFKKRTCAVCLLLSVLTLCGCSRRDPASETLPVSTERITLPTAPIVEETVPPTDPKDSVETLTAVLEAGELYTLAHYPNLKTADLTGSTCYEAIRDFSEKHPEIDIVFAVNVGQIEISTLETAVTLSPDSFDYPLLMENLQYLPNLASISLPDCRLDANQVNTLLDTYPQLTMDYTVDLLGTVLDNSITELDLTHMTSSQVEESLPKLGLLTNLTDVKLSNSLSMEDVAQLQDANPNATFHYTFSLFGKTLSTTDEEVSYVEHSIGNEGETQIRQALAILDNCSRFLLDDCGLDYEVLAQIREDFRDGPKVVWRIRFGVGDRYTTVTDDDTILAVKNVTDKTCGPMKYLEDVKYMDIGHNEYLTDLSFLAYMPKLEVLIASQSAVTDISSIENCKNLIWLELAYCGYLENIEAVAGCENLKYLNLSYTKVKDLMPLDGLPLERFVYLKPKVSKEEQEIFLAIHPKDICITVFYGYSQPYGYGWRYNDNGKTMFWYYKDVVREVFGYDSIDAQVAAQKKAEGK